MYKSKLKLNNKPIKWNLSFLKLKLLIARFIVSNVIPIVRTNNSEKKHNGGV